MRAIGSILAAAALVSSVTRATGASADSPPADPRLSAARDLFIDAEKDEDAQRWADALEKLQRVAVVKATPGVRYHMALCEEHLGRLVEALQDYQAAGVQARKESATDVLRLVDKRVAEATDRIPRLVVVLVTDAPDVTVSVDGEPAQLGAPLSLDPGTHAIDAQATGRVPFSAKVTLQEHDSISFQVKLDPSTPAPPAETRPPEPSRESSSYGAETRAASGHLTIAFVEAAVALGLAAGGVAAYVAGTTAHSNAVAACAQIFTEDASACDSRKDLVRTWDWVAVGAWAGAAGVGTLAVLSFVKAHRQAHEAREARALTPSANLVVGPASVGLQGTF